MHHHHILPSPLHFSPYPSCNVLELRNSLLLSKVPSVPSDNNCLSWTGNGTVIVQVVPLMSRARISRSHS